LHLLGRDLHGVDKHMPGFEELQGRGTLLGEGGSLRSCAQHRLCVVAGVQARGALQFVERCLCSTAVEREFGPSEHRARRMPKSVP
jgi:hypothetical protein